MADYLLWSILGLANGAVVAYIALGIVLGYRGSGVINFSQGAIGMYGAYVFFGLRTTGRYLLPVPGLPGFWRIGPKSGFGVPMSLVLTLATAIVLGLIVHFLVFAPLRNAPTLARVVASIGLMAALGSIVAYRYGTETLSMPNYLPKGNLFKLGGVQVPGDRLVVAGAAIIAAIALLGLFRFTRFGLATRAAAENERGAILLGVSPDFQAGVSWVLATLLATLGGILVAPITQLTPTGFTFLVIPALAACLIARFTSFGVTVTAALLIAAVGNIVANLGYKYTWFPRTGMADTLPFIVIIIVMFVQGKSLPERGHSIEGRLQAVPPTRRRIVLPAVAFAVVATLLYTVTPNFRLALNASLIGAVVCLSMVVITGFVAQVSLLQMTLAGMAAFLLAGLGKGDVPWPLSPLLAIVGGTIVGTVAAIPALRVRGVNLAVVTLAGGWAIEASIFNNPKYTGGFEGTTVVDPTILGRKISYSAGRTIGQPLWGICALIATTAVALMVSNLRRSATGRQLLAVRTNERAAAAMGINVATAKLTAFAISAAIASVAGTMMAYQQSLLTAASTQTFSVFVTIAVLAVAFLGGITSVSGGLVGGAIIAGGLMPQVLDSLIFSKSSNGVALLNLLGGIGLIFTAIRHPEGIAGALRHPMHNLESKLEGLVRRTRVAEEVPA